MDDRTPFNLLDLDREALLELLAERGDRPFRATQLMKWIYHRQVTDYAAMTDLSREFRTWLTENARIDLPVVASDQKSRDGTRKWLFELADGNCVETVYIPDGERGTLCVSSQVGCPIDCTFCATARQGFSRNLTTGEIVSQLWLARWRRPNSSRTESGRVWIASSWPQTSPTTSSG